MVIQIIVTIGIILLVFPTIYSAYKRKSISLFALIIWFIFWIAGLTIIWNPSIMVKISNFMGIARGIDTIVYLSIIFLFYMIFTQKIRMNEMKREMTQLVRKLAIKDIEETKKK